MKGVILAAGEGRRLRPLTARRPKPMLPAGNKPVLEHVLTALRAAGVHEIVLVVGYRKERIQNYFGDGDRLDVDLSYVVQSPRLGTGHALLQAEPHVGGEFVALNGDRIIEPSVVEQVRDRRRETGDPVMAVTDVETPSDYGVVELDGDRIVDLREQPPEALTTSNLINAGVYGLGPEMFSALREADVEGELGLTAPLTDGLDQRPVRPVRYRGLWVDVTTPWDLVDVNARIVDHLDPEHADSASIAESAVVASASVVGENSVVRPNATVMPGTVIGPNVSVGPNVVLENTVVLPDATFEPGVTLADCVVGANAHVGPGTVAEGGRADVTLDDTVHDDVLFGGLVGDNSRLGGNVTIAPGTVLGNDATVGSGARLDGRYESDIHVVHG